MRFQEPVGHALAGEVDLVLRLLERNAVDQPADDPSPRARAEFTREGVEPDGHPELIPNRVLEPGRRHADHRARDGSDSDRAPHDVRVASQPRLPQAVPDHDDVRRADGLRPPR